MTGMLFEQAAVDRIEKNIKYSTIKYRSYSYKTKLLKVTFQLHIVSKQTVV